MTLRFSHGVELAHPPERVFQVLSDPVSLAARYTASGSADVDVLEHRPDGGGDAFAGGGLVVVHRRVEAGSLPAPVAGLVRGAARITQTDTWQAVDSDGGRIADWTVETAGLAVRIGGTITLAPVAGGTRLTESGTVSARVPVVSGLIERLAVEQSALKLRREWDWLAAHL